jgi:GT2 family glycosyltransferase
MRFAAFIMTYERADILSDTIGKILSQTFPPEKILVVDNSESMDTSALLARSTDPKIEYLRVGYNAGPAGAAKIGLQRLADEGFDWIYWGDDNDPPRSPLIFEKLLSLTSAQPAIGALGAVGGRWNKLTGRTRTLSNAELKGLTEVDFIAGGRNFIVSAAPVRNNILPSEDLFFGFEELDFCLKLKAAGYRIFIDGDSLLQSRAQAGKGASDFRWQGKKYGTVQPTSRSYYSTRNMLIILKKNHLYLAMIFLIVKTLFKMVFSFKYGLAYGKKAFRLYYSALRDFVLNRRQKADLA